MHNPQLQISQDQNGGARCVEICLLCHNTPLCFFFKAYERSPYD
jgi:hypothetical protein